MSSCGAQPRVSQRRAARRETSELGWAHGRRTSTVPRRSQTVGQQDGHSIASPAIRLPLNPLAGSVGSAESTSFGRGRCLAPRRLVAVFGCMTAVVTVLASVLPAIRTGAFTFLGLGSSAVIIYGVRRYRPGRAWAWFAIAAVPALASAAGVLYVLLPGHIGHLKPYLWTVLLLRLAVFAFTLIGLVGLAHTLASGPEQKRTALVDLVVLLFGAGLLAGVVAALPFAVRPDLPDFVEVVRAVYAVTDVVLLVAVSNLLTGVRWSVPACLIALGSLSLLCFDAVYLLGGTDAAWPTGTAWDLGWIVFSAAWGTAALLPGMADLRARDRASVNPAPVRLVLVVGAALLPLVLLLAESVQRPSWYVLVLTGAFTIMLGLVLARLVAVTLELRRQVAGERGLREAVTQLAAAADPEAVKAVVERVVPTLLPKRIHGRVEVNSADEPPSDAALGPPGGKGDRGALLTFPLGTGASPDQLTMNLHGDRTALDAVRPRLEAVASQASLSLDRIRLGQEVVWRANCEYFDALVQTAADGVLMVDDDDRVSLASPSARTILGRSHLKSTWLPGLVDESQREEASQLLARARGGESVPPGMAISLQGNDRSPSAGTTNSRSGRADGVHWTVPHDDGSSTLVEVACHKVDEEPSIRGVVVNLHDVTEQQRLREELTESSGHDQLTGLPTRPAIRDLTRQALERAAGSGTVVGKMHIDFDNFAQINDRYGYEVGDTVLQALAHRLKEAVPPGGAAARLGGDAFAVLIENAPHPAAVDELAHQVAATLAGPIPVDDEVVACTASVGVATTAHADSVDDLVRQADFALRAAKGTGTGRIRHYDPSMHDEARDRLELRSALERALDDDALSLRYQPIIALDTGQTAGFEALLRWQHPTHGWVSPELFVDIAEESGLIEPIGEWVLTTALNQMRVWDQMSGVAVPHVGVNVSVQQFRSSGFVRRIDRHLATSGLTPARLHLEITESLLLPDDEQIWEELQQLRRLGIRIAMDDFGRDTHR